MIGYSVIDAHLASLDATAWKVYIALFRRKDSDGICWPSQETIAKAIGKKVRVVRYALSRLAKNNLITIERQAGKPTIYHITPAPDCHPDNEGAAPDCQTPRQNNAGTPAKSCHKPRQSCAIEVDKGSRYKNKGRSKAAYEVSEIPIPESLRKPRQCPKCAQITYDNTDLVCRDCNTVLPRSFLVAWQDWQKHRREIKKSLTPSCAKAQLKKLEAMGAAKAIESIDFSIEKGWTGIFEPGGNGKAAADAKPVDDLPLLTRRK
jgi:hypothetical protein